MFVMESEHSSCPHNHSPGVIYDCSEVLWVLVNTVQIALEEEWLLEKKSTTDDLVGLIIHSGILERSRCLNLDVVKFYFYLYPF